MASKITNLPNGGFSRHDSPRPSRIMDVETPSAMSIPRPNSPRPCRTMDIDLPAHPAAMSIDPILSHKQTFIILHGRGSFAERFAPPLLEMVSSAKETLQDAFPHAKIIFPTATRNRATIYKKSFTHQWFNSWHLEDYKNRQHMMRDGLHGSCQYIHFLLQREIKIIGAENVVLWGLSQGCATSLSSMLTWDGEAFAAVVGMCGWLPFGNLVEEVAAEGTSTGNPFAVGGGFGDQDDGDPFASSDDHPFAHSDGEDNDEPKAKDPQRAAVEFFREEIDMNEKKGMCCQKVPVFLGHGTADETVPFHMGEESKRCLDLVGVDVKFEVYPELGHWYSEDMLKDIFQFLREKLNVEKETVA